MPQIMVSLEPECDIPVPGIFHFFGGIGTGIGKIWYQKKVSEPVSEKFDPGTDFRCQNLGILKIYNGYRYRIGTGTENFSFFWWYRNRYRKNLVPEKVSEPVWKIAKKSNPILKFSCGTYCMKV